MFREPIYFIRLMVAWVFTLLMSAVYFLIAFNPRLAWVVMVRPWARGTLGIMGIRWEIEGLENLKGPAVFICNHQSIIDVALMPAILPRTVKFVAKKEILRVPLWGWALSNGGGLMIDRKDPRGAIAAINDGLTKMPKDWSVAVFPEGTRTRDGSLGPFKKGAFHIALQCKLPLVPVGIEGAWDAMPKNVLLPRPAKIFITVGKPVPTTDWLLANLDEHVCLGHQLVTECRTRSLERRRHARAEIEAQTVQDAPVQ